MDTTAAPHSIPFMTDDDQLAAVASRSRSQALQVHDRLPIGKAITVTGTAAANGGTLQVTVPFGRTFASPPLVTAVVSGFVAGTGGLFVRMCDSVTTTNFRLTIYNANANAVTITAVAPLPVTWTAVPA